MASPFTTFPIAATFAVSEWGLPVNVKDFGAVGNGSNDDTAAIQAAIDYAFANNRKATYIPAGIYKITSPLYLDPPTNLRVNFANPPDIQFSGALIGDRGGPNTTGDGTQIVPTFDNAAAIYVGPGQGMNVAYIQILGPGLAYNGAQNANGIGIGLTSTGGGSSRTVIEQVGVHGYFTGFKTSSNGYDALCEQNTFIKCWTNNVYVAAWVFKTQNFINGFYDCAFTGCTIGILTDVGGGARVFGGNYSGNAGVAGNFAIGSTSVVTTTGSSPVFTYSFNTTITAPDAYVGVATVYSAYCIKTAKFGLIPLTLVSFNTGTNVASFRIRTDWANYYYYDTNAVTDTDLSAEIQACPRLYAAEVKTTFWGACITVHGVHIENAFAPNTLINNGVGFGAAPSIHLAGIQYNVDPSLVDVSTSGATTPDLAKFYCQQVTPFINAMGEAPITIEDSNFQQSGNMPILISQSYSTRLVMRNMKLFGPVNYMTFRGGSPYRLNIPQLGGGEFDVTPFLSRAQMSGNTTGDHWRVGYLGQHPAWGWRPAVYSKPAITPDILTTIVGTLPVPTWNGSNTWNGFTWPPLWGGQIYCSMDWYITPAQNYEIISNHHFYSYGTDFTVANNASQAWSYKGQSVCVYADEGTLQLVFPGLAVKLNDGVSDVLYMVTGVYPVLGYFTVCDAQNINGTSHLSGLKTSTFTGTTIKQEPFAIQVVSGPKTAVTKTADFVPAPLENNIIVNKGSSCTVTLPSAATYNGRSITIKTIQAFTVVSASSNVVPQAGGSAGTAILAATAGKWAQLVANGANWEIIQSN